MTQHFNDSQYKGALSNKAKYILVQSIGLPSVWFYVTTTTNIADTNYKQPREGLNKNMHQFGSGLGAMGVNKIIFLCYFLFIFNTSDQFPKHINHIEL